MPVYRGNGARWYSYFWIKPRLIFSFYLCLRLTSPNYAFMRCRLYSNQKKSSNMWQSACMVIHPITVYSYGFFSCKTVRWVRPQVEWRSLPTISNCRLVPDACLCMVRPRFSFALGLCFITVSLFNVFVLL